MCGIVGAFVRSGSVVPGLIQGLRTLEYRGYDSAGIGAWLDGRVQVRKRRRGKRPPIRREALLRQRERARRLQAKRDYSKVLEAGLVEHLIVAPSLWQGEVTLPEAPSGDTRYRLVVAEYEEYLVDGAAPHFPLPSEKGRRMVYVEHVELD